MPIRLADGSVERLLAVAVDGRAVMPAVVHRGVAEPHELGETIGTIRAARLTEEADDIGLNARACERPVADIAVVCVSRNRGSCTTWNDAVLHIHRRICETCSWRNDRRKERPRPKKNRLHPIANCRSSMCHA